MTVLFPSFVSLLTPQIGLAHEQETISKNEKTISSGFEQARGIYTTSMTTLCLDLTLVWLTRGTVVDTHILELDFRIRLEYVWKRLRYF